MGAVSEGSMVGGYCVESLLGSGGMGSVYCARQVSLDRLVALKLIAPEFADDIGFRERFRREALAAAAIDHPNVVSVFAADEADGCLYIAMQFVEGEDLATLERAGGPFELEFVVRLATQLAGALDAAHARGIVHRDVKPGNVLISGKPGREHAFLTDFGIAKRGGHATALTSPGGIVGSLDYIAPEQIEGDGLDARTDVYALGCVVFEMLAGGAPFASDEDIATKLHAHLSRPAPSVRTLRPELPADVDAVIQRSLAKQPDARFASAGEFADELARAAAGLQPPRAQMTRALPATPVRTNLRAPSRELIGRDSDLEELVSLCGDGGASILSVTGPGGVGKTRLALAAAQRILGDFRDGVFLVELEMVPDADGIAAAIAGALGLPDAQGVPPLERVAEYLREREVLLVLDNFEHLLEAAGDLAELVGGAPDTRLLITRGAR